MAHNIQSHLKEGHVGAVLPADGFENAGADDRVRFHDGALFRFEPAGFEKDMIRDSHLANVVQQHTALQHAHRGRIHHSGKGRQLDGFLGQDSHIALHAQ